MKFSHTDFQTKCSPDASVDPISKGYRLSIPGGSASQYRIAQLDDYAKLARKDYPHRPSLSLSLRARASRESIPGTWGFGFWNNPFGLSIGFGGDPFRIPALPNAIWFFQASEENHLSFSNKPGNGFLAQVFRTPVLRFPKIPLGVLSRLAKVGVTIPFSRRKARALMCEIVEEDGDRLDVDVTDWHGYRFEWSPTRSAFWVDETLVMETSVSPRPPLGLVIWIDNQYAAWRPDGKMGFGVLENTEPAWLEIEALKLNA